MGAHQPGFRGGGIYHLQFWAIAIFGQVIIIVVLTVYYIFRFFLFKLKKYEILCLRLLLSVDSTTGGQASCFCREIPLSPEADDCTSMCQLAASDDH